MRIRTLILSSTILAVLHLTSGFSQPASPSTNGQVALLYINTGEFSDSDGVQSGSTFMAINNTTNHLMITLTGIEVQRGSLWVRHTPLDRILQFPPLVPEFPPRRYPDLQPNRTAYDTVYLPSRPTNGTWRVTATVDAQLTGLDAAAVRLRRLPRTLERRIETGNTNYTLNPFATNMIPFHSLTSVVTQAISE